MDDGLSHTVPAVRMTSGSIEIAQLSPAEFEAKSGTGVRDSRRSRDASGTCIALVDRYSFTRQCIAQALQGLSSDHVVLSFASFEDVPMDETQIDLLLYHWHENDPDFEDPAEALPALREIADIMPLVLLSSLDHPETIIPTLQKGVRGYIPVESTTLELMLKIIQLIEAGGTFIPEASLTQRPANTEAAAVPPARETFTAREKAVLALLKCGKANKVIAHELSMSVSTVKAHIRSIMRKLRVRNRTEAVSRAYLDMSLALAISIPIAIAGLAPLTG